MYLLLHTVLFTFMLRRQPVELTHTFSCRWCSFPFLILILPWCPMKNISSNEGRGDFGFLSEYFKRQLVRKIRTAKISRRIKRILSLRKYLCYYVTNTLLFPSDSYIIKSIKKYHNLGRKRKFSLRKDIKGVIA